jgi:predicted dehydrogenase
MALRRIVVVGCGSIGRRHARVLKNRTDIILELCEPDSANLARSLDEVGDVPTHTDFHVMLKTQPDMVIIATPHFLHAEQSIAALSAGIHVLCEKPMSDSLDNAQRMWDVVKDSDAVFSVGFTLHFYPAMKAIKDVIASGELGTILHAHWHIGTYITLMNSVSRYQATTEGALLLDYVHQPDLLYWWFGKHPTAVFAVGHQSGDQELQSNPNVMLMTIEYDGNFLATIHLNYGHGSKPQKVRVTLSVPILTG